MLLVKLLKQLMLTTSKKVKRYETEIKAFGKCLELKILEEEQRLS
jgi:hypothetical protein